MKLISKKEFIKYYMREKDAVIFKDTAAHLYCEKDFTEIDTWKSEDIKYIVENLKNLSFDFDDAGDTHICVQCIYSKKKLEWENPTWGICALCSYGKIHGCCLLEKSTYQEILEIYSREGKSDALISNIDDGNYEMDNVVQLFFKWNLIG